MAHNIQSALPILTDGDTYRVTSPFGLRVVPMQDGVQKPHYGIDLVVWKGYGALSAIGAAWDGIVTAVRDTVDGFSDRYSEGNYVEIDHGDGVVSKYFHLKKGSITVSVGEQVCPGQNIGMMGSTGYSDGAHLHFQVEIQGVPVDPEKFITGEESPFGEPYGGADDNEPEPWSEDAVNWAIQNGIIFGDENGNLMLKQYCTREQMLVFLYRAVGGGS